MRTFVESQLDIVGKECEQLFSILYKNVVALVIRVESVGDEDERVGTRFPDGVQLLCLIFEAVGSMTRRDDREASARLFFKLLCTAVHAAVQFDFFFK